MENYPLKLPQDATYQSHTSRLTELWSLPKPAQGLNTYNNNNIQLFCVVFYVIKTEQKFDCMLVINENA